MRRSPASSEEEEGRGSEYPEGDSDSGSSREGPPGTNPGPPRARGPPRPPPAPDDTHFSMMVFRIGIPDLHQTVRGGKWGGGSRGGANGEGPWNGEKEQNIGGG